MFNKLPVKELKTRKLGKKTTLIVIFDVCVCVLTLISVCTGLCYLFLSIHTWPNHTSYLTNMI